jgi:hypothetical protein
MNFWENRRFPLVSYIESIDPDIFWLARGKLRTVLIYKPEFDE